MCTLFQLCVTIFLPNTTAWELHTVRVLVPGLQMEAVDQLQVENRELRGVQERLGRKERRAMELKKKNAELGEQHTKLLEDYEASQEQVGTPSSQQYILPRIPLVDTIIGCLPATNMIWCQYAL